MAFIPGKSLLGTGLAGALAAEISAVIKKFDLKGSATYLDAEAKAIVDYILAEYPGGAGPTGPQGTRGSQGSAGPQGSRGSQGTAGGPGSPGSQSMCGTRESSIAAAWAPLGS